MRWIKASDGLPVNSGMYITKMLVTDEGLPYHPVGYNYFESTLKSFPNTRICTEQATVTEWLDESSTSVEQERQRGYTITSVTGESEAIGFAEWIGNEALEYDGKGNWLTPELKERNDKVYSIEYINPRSTKELYKEYIERSKK